MLFLELVDVQIYFKVIELKLVVEKVREISLVYYEGPVVKRD